MTDWVGYAVSVNCGETLGCYQGTIVETDGTTITLTKAFRNGFQYPKPQVTLNAADIKELRIIEPRAERAESCGTVPGLGGGASAGVGGASAGVGGAGRRARATVCEALQANHNHTTTSNQIVSSNVSNISGGKSCKKSGVSQTEAASTLGTEPVDIQPSRKNNNNNSLAGSYGNGGSTPKSRGQGFGGRGEGAGGPAGGPAGGAGDKARRRNEACFGDLAEPALLDDFDFEGNLALFDKRAVWATMRHSKPDVVRTADESKYRHDENVLGGGVAGGGGGGSAGGVCVPAALRGRCEYVTDAGARVPSVAGAVRRRLWEELRRHGLADFARAMVARAAADLALRLVGGTRRLEARNAHQTPLVVVVAGAHDGGATGLAAGRLLASRGARLQALLAEPRAPCPALELELRALALDAAPVHERTSALPPAPDLVIVALYDPLRDNTMEQYEAACAWVESCRAGVVCVEPAGGGWRGAGARASVLGLAAVDLPPQLGRLYLADVAAPHRIYADRRLQYRVPFGAAPALALHPAD